MTLKIFFLFLGLYTIQTLKLHIHQMKSQEIHTKNWGHYNDDNHPNFVSSKKQNDWLSRIIDTIKVDQLSIPGTHNTGTWFCIQHQLCNWNKCQSWNIKDQLDSGIRYLDMRVQFGRDMLLAHGAFQFRNLLDELRVIRDWMKNNPKEFILIQFQQEYTEIEGWQAGKRVIEGLQMHGIQTWIGSIAPTVGQLRGKVWLIDTQSIDFGKLGVTLSLNTADPNIIETSHFHIQNDYTIFPWEIGKKVQQIMQTLKRPCYEGQMKINFMNASGGVQPFWLAKMDGGTNESILSWLRKHEGRRCLGVVLMDFPGVELIRRIIDSNFM